MLYQLNSTFSDNILNRKGYHLACFIDPPPISEDGNV